MDFDEKWFSTVEQAVIAQYNKLKVKGDIDNSVLAGFLLYNSEENNLKVISLATGTKLMSGDQRDKDKAIGPIFVHDCHAEILARRCLQKWIWSELNDLFKERHLDPKYTLHFYTSTPPCGDCCVHIKPDAVLVETGAKPFGWDQSQLATSPPNIVRGKPGRGSRSPVMSCSDKITTWIHAGLEGNLLSSFVDPIYLKTICVGNGNLESCQRCFFKRLPNTSDVKIICGVSEWKQNLDSPAASSVSYCIGEDYELISPKFGRKFGVIPKNQENPRFMPSVCDAMMLRRYCLKKSIKNIKFGEAKLQNKEYNDKKNKIKEELLKHGGTWAPKLQEEKDWEYDEERMTPKLPERER
ncbi:hypothetical protein TVAG_069930 [Trichomonas vaginalis G3]|uniref:A to I editase domain-containing protein n=1 Tax=Trichomonas vaginalis (strain ATCC PRA-98 / G3) TaxID=412133 RepID=A2ESN4_TRIV3|nr:adenosine deaminase protein [Trichomonas vaginalis G3]EAY04343.1 hypothetical protein TVAG_069930 [Trichomonas vaginalis G3]KAI5551916.1 adenosine deaminase protein [Trichomonas vaginalis G3]|eukprot:XP_001316566.1 hypothetical protein [Trichomonas vaginalis G3]